MAGCVCRGGGTSIELEKTHNSGRGGQFRVQLEHPNGLGEARLGAFQRLWAAPARARPAELDRHHMGKTLFDKFCHGILICATR